MAVLSLRGLCLTSLQKAIRARAMNDSQFYYNKYKALGLCTKCGKNEAAPERTMCKKCLAKKAARAKAARDKDRTVARAYNNEYHRQRKAKAIAEGMCSKCFHEPADKGYKTCWRCRANGNDGKPKKRSDAQKARAKENAKARRERLVAAHICIRCGKRPAREKFKDCGICAAKVNRRRRELKYQRGQAIPAYMRGDGTYCKMCCKPKCNGEKLCDECRDKARKSIAKVNEANSIHGGWGTLDFRKIKYEVKPT